MLGSFAFILALAAGPATDPRPALIELQLAGRNREALARTEQELADRPEPARQMGLDYLRGHLLHLLGRSEEAARAFAAAMVGTPDLALYSRYRLAVEQDRMRHPEVAAGLVAAVVGSGQPSPYLQPEAVRLLCSTLASGGDCRLIRTLPLAHLQPLERRLVQLARADCVARTGDRELARSQLAAIIEESIEDEAARAAAERLSALVSERERGRLPHLVGLTFHIHREFDRALLHLQRGSAGGGSERDRLATLYAIGRSYFGQGSYLQAAITFGKLAQLAGQMGAAEERARALFHQGRAYELAGQPRLAGASFQHCYLASPKGKWAAPALFSGLRLDWKAGNATGAAALYALLAANWEWRQPAARAALFLAAGDLAGGRRERARGWLAQAARGRVDKVELAYWQGRLAELEGRPLAAVAAYVEALRTDRFHPLGEGAAHRLAGGGLARTAQAEGRRLAGSSRAADLLDAWLLLGDGDPVGRRARSSLMRRLAAEPASGPFLRLAPVPVARWPLWRNPPRSPEDRLLALGILDEGAPAVEDYFPASDPPLAFTGARLLARAGETRRSIRLADAVRSRMPARLPLALAPGELQTLLYPLAYREVLAAEGRLRGVDPHLLAAVVREESLFDPYALSPSAARGLTQFVFPTARRLASRLDLKTLSPEDLYRPEVSIALGAVHLADLGRVFGAPHLTVAAYAAGAEQTRLWRSYCATPEPEEFFTKVGFEETRDYLRRVMTSWAQYERLY